MKECTVYGNENGSKFKFKFMFGTEDYLETLCEELEKKNNKKLESVERIYINEKELPKKVLNNGGKK
ncbi:hypothetical protein [Clostridium beijerinckii]|uniref:hypothetical protein n=1 Tax=Clostridium beijerinckii TaxID=1520 RepID=UPI00047A1B25|nr:hypothetical protein [Clostridium beijerinckii]